MSNQKTEWLTDSFKSLSANELYEILRLRSEVFVVEQNCVYQDLDNKDQIAIHIRGYYNNNLIAYCRLFNCGQYFDDASIGRVIVSPAYRRKNFGHELLDIAIPKVKELFGESKITISAQLYLKDFYQIKGFVQVSDIYTEDNLPHIRMTKG